MTDRTNQKIICLAQGKEINVAIFGRLARSRSTCFQVQKRAVSA